MKNIAVLLSMSGGSWVEKLQSAAVGFWAVVPFPLATIRPAQPTALPVTGVPKADRAYVPSVAGPTVLYGFQRPYRTASGSSLKFPARSNAVGTLNIPLPLRCSRVWSKEKKKKVLFLPL